MKDVTPDVIAITIICGIVSGIISTYVVRILDKRKNDRHCGKSGR